jgi:hypothetical protein
VVTRPSPSEDLPIIPPEELPADTDVHEDRSVTPDDADAEPAGIEDVRQMQTSVGAASEGVLLDEDLEQARLRVRDVQVILVALGYLDKEHGDIEVTGEWSQRTRDAVADFQDDHGLDRGGQIDGVTYEALLAEHEAALEAKEPTNEPDEFEPVHPEKPLSR